MPGLPESSVLRNRDHIEFRLPSDGDDAPFLALSTVEAGSMSWKDSRGPEHRQRLYDNLGIEVPVHAQLQQHTKLVNPVSDKTLRNPPVQTGDGLRMPRGPGFLSATVADCMPVYIWHRKIGEIILLHSGWKGTGILAEALLRYSPRERKEEITVFLGPSIADCCYQVDRERYNLFRGSFGGRAVREEEGHYFLSLLQANLGIAEKLEVTSVYYYNPCTCCNPEFGSFRRQGPQKFSSMLALIGYFQ